LAVELSSLTQARLASVFANVEHRTQASELLETECAEDLSLWNDVSVEGLDRVRLAVLKLSGGELQRLRDTVALAKTDWRDVLVAAGFGNDVMAHLKWRP